jgi:hypothetical protein
MVETVERWWCCCLGRGWCVGEDLWRPQSEQVALEGCLIMRGLEESEGL